MRIAGVIAQGRSADAQVPLRAAASALQQYAQSSGPRANDARMLQQQISSYKVGQNAADARAKIEGWWDQVTNWINQGSQSAKTS